MIYLQLETCCRSEQWGDNAGHHAVLSSQHQWQIQCLDSPSWPLTAAAAEIMLADCWPGATVCECAADALQRNPPGRPN